MSGRKPSSRDGHAPRDERGGVVTSPTLVDLARALAEVAARACFRDADPTPIDRSADRGDQTP